MVCVARSSWGDLVHSTAAGGQQTDRLWLFSKRGEYPLPPFVAPACHDTPLLRPGPDYAGRDTDLGGELPGSQSSGGKQALFEAWEMVDVAEPRDGGDVEGGLCACGVASLVEDGGDLAVGVLIEERVGGRDDLGVGLPLVREWQCQGRHRTTAEADVHCDVLAPQQGHVLDQQREHPLALALRRARVGPQRRKVACEAGDAVPRGLIVASALGLSLPLDLLPRHVERAECLVPVRFQRGVRITRCE